MEIGEEWGMSGRLSCVVVTGEERTCRTSFHDRGPGWKQGDRMYSRT